jgi:transcription initiation factor TFIIIB Brf1 subunit/transcription initiation factor TFIIB
MKCGLLASYDEEGSMATCPKCGSSRIETYMMTYGPMWCLDCGFRVEDKSVAPNPFLDEADLEAARHSPESQSLGQALFQLSRGRRKTSTTRRRTVPDSGDGEKPTFAADAPAEE